MYTEPGSLKGKETVVLVIHLLLCYSTNSPGFKMDMAGFESTARQCQENFHVCVCQCGCRSTAINSVNIPPVDFDCYVRNTVYA